MVEELPDQSIFDASQAVLQPPPLPLHPLSEAQKKRRLMWLIIAIMVVVAIVIIGLLPTKKLIQETPTSTPQPSPTISTNQMQEIINQVTMEVKQANPEDVLLPPPQVDMNVEF